jgi:toxin YoeB
MRTISFHAQGWEDFTGWPQHDPKIFSRLVRLISETAKDPFGGIGKPEPLKHQLKGYWSRRITDEHRLVYKITEDSIIIASCRYHYR